MNTRIVHMLRKEFIQVLRDRKMAVIVFIAPVIQLVIFGYAVTTDVRDVKISVLDLDRGEMSREVIRRFEGSGHFIVRRYLSSFEEMYEELDSGSSRGVVHIPPGFGDAVHGSTTGRVQILVDGSDASTTSVILSYAARIIASVNREMLVERVARSGGSGGRRGVEIVSRAWYNPNLASRIFFVPGVLALLVALMSLMLAAMAIARETEMGTIEQIIVSPISPLEFILGKTAPFLIIAFIDVMVVSAVSIWWFEVPVRGSFLLLLGGMCLFVLNTLGMGLLVSTISRTQQQAMLSGIFYLLPAILLSGFAFPLRNIPDVVYPVTYANPLRYMISIVRGVFLKGVGIEVLWPEFGALAILGTITIGVASTRFRKTLE